METNLGFIKWEAIIKETEIYTGYHIKQLQEEIKDLGEDTFWEELPSPLYTWAVNQVSEETDTYKAIQGASITITETIKKYMESEEHKESEEIWEDGELEYHLGFIWHLLNYNSEE